ncbi:hydroxyacylglutathione hydrolase [Sphingomonas sp. M1A8_2b]
MTSPSIEIVLFACLEDNYGFLVRDRATDRVATIDTPDAARIAAELDRRGWGLDLVLNTHWHDDHVGGNLPLKARYGARIVAPAVEADRIPGVDIGVGDGATVALGDTIFTVMETPGHTVGHVAYATPGTIFVGDTLFAMGCGRLFEGSASQMWGNMVRLSALPPETTVYCAHEYTEANARFALHVEPENAALRKRAEHVAALRARGAPTIPFTIADERASNPFMRAGSAEILAERRRAKDMF